jgi:hypothetical protein
MRLKLKLLLFTGLMVLASCSRQAVLSSSDNRVESRNIEQFFSTPQKSSIKQILKPNEKLLCVLFPVGVFNRERIPLDIQIQLETLDVKWINDDSYWTIVFFHELTHKPTRIYGIDRSVVVDILSTSESNCFDSNAFVEIHENLPVISYKKSVKFSER